MKVPVTQHVINASTFSRKQGSKIIFFLLFGRSKATAFLLCSALLLSFSIYAQNTIPVKGRVTDAKGDPVATASITVKGTATRIWYVRNHWSEGSSSTIPRAQQAFRVTMHYGRFPRRKLTWLQKAQSFHRIVGINV